MSRKTLIFGNGLGMALNPDFFSLNNAIGEVWNGDSIARPSKELILQCLPGNDNDRPHGENELDNLHLALTACEFLNNVNEGDLHWLNEQGQNFPEAVRKFI